MPKRSPLHDVHRASGAAFIERDGWELPAHFGDAAREYRAVRASAGLIDLAHRALLQFTGPDRLSFLQGMLSNDLRGLKPFDGVYAALLTQQGKIVADTRLLCAMNSFYLDFWENLKERILEHLNRYLIADEVEIADRSQEYTMISIQGPRSQELLGQVIGRSATALPSHPKQHTMIDIDGAAVCAVFDSYTGEGGYDLIAPLPAIAGIAAELTDAAGPFSAAWVGEEAQNTLRLEAGIPRYGLDFSEDNLLLEADLDRAVSFTKGCYLGQEVVERIRSRGHVNKKLSGLLLDGAIPAAAGARIQAGSKPAGVVTSSVFSPALKRAIALGYLSKDFWSAGTTVLIKSGEAEVPATVAERPFLRSS